jgi:DNA repair exonuclease SbcCD ATPase subunit
MIVLKKLRYQNINSTGNVFTEIDLGKTRTTLVIGVNGAGKSTLLDALCFALYKKPVRRVTLPTLINTITNKNLLVEVEFEKGSTQWLVRRGLKPAVFEIFRDGELVNQNACGGDYQDYLEAILGLNFKSFLQVVILGSANYTPFMLLTGPQRREVVEDLLDLGVFSTMNKLLKDRVDENKKAVAGIDASIRVVEGSLEVNARHLAAAKTDTEALIAEKEERIATLAGEVVELTEKAEALSQEAEELAGATAFEREEEIGRQLDSLQKDKTQFEWMVTNAVKFVEFLSAHSNCPSCAQELSKEYQLNMAKEKNAEIKEFEKKIKKLDKKIDTLRTELDVLVAKEKDLARKHQALTGQAREAKINADHRKSTIKGLMTEVKALMTEKPAQLDLTEDLQRQLKELEADRGRVATQQRVLSQASTLLKDGGIKAKMVAQYLPAMNAMVNKYLASMDFFVDFHLDGNFDETIKSRGRDTLTYHALSEGEKKRIDLAILLAWRALARQRNSSSVSLLILDEIFDSSLDSGGAEDFLSIINAQADGSNVFIISHRGDQLVDKFEDVIRFTKVKNFSTISD